MKAAGFVHLNGRIVAAKTAAISPFDRGFLYADGLLETLRAYNGQAFALERHVGRLSASAEFLEIPVPAVSWAAAVARLLQRNRLTDAWVRITLTRGPATRGLDIPKRQTPTLLIAAGCIDPAIASRQRRGVRLVSVPHRRDPYLAAHKTLNYLPAILARTAAARAGAYDALFTDARGGVFETTTANIFVVRGDEISTPREGVLPGVTRALVIAASRELGFRVRERPFTLGELAGADEAFLTSSLVEVLPVLAVDDVRIGAKRGPRTRQLQSAYRRLATARDDGSRGAIG
jgi:branched-chain amino acid aminotransferase